MDSTVDSTSASANRDRWQKYKEWLIAHAAAVGFPADGNMLQFNYEAAPVPIGDKSRCEARAWMKNPVAPGELAVNRFDTDEAASAFIENLYALGAEVVYVTNVDHRKINFDRYGPHADTLIVVLPDDPQQRRALLNIYEIENYDRPGEPVDDNGEKEIGFWWD